MGNEKIPLATLLLALSFNAQAGSVDGKAISCEGDLHFDC